MKPIPEGYHTLTAYLPVDDAAAAIDWYTKAFGAKERMRMEGPGGSIGHAELQIGDSVIMLSDPFPQSKSRPPKEIGAATSGIYMFVEDVDAAFKQAIDAGASCGDGARDHVLGRPLRVAHGSVRPRSGRSPPTSRTCLPRR